MIINADGTIVFQFEVLKNANIQVRLVNIKQWLLVIKLGEYFRHLLRRTQSIKPKYFMQLYAYNQFWNVNRVMLLFPGNARCNFFEPFQNEIEKSNTDCKVGFVNVLNAKN